MLSQGKTETTKTASNRNPHEGKGTKDPLKEIILEQFAPMYVAWPQEPLIKNQDYSVVYLGLTDPGWQQGHMISSDFSRE